ncbi:hypothetical protein [uncultured Methanoregula sp.]|uniref:hypothetical protein n=1 Tax=uncultured Methanoregula sp. TaxID=1005933 RepID=UPI002AAA9F2E|nr:hypothetical protein [uncultured Methanoregula sp.]
MECASLKRSLFKECKGICILLLGVVIVMGWLILFIAGGLSLGTWLPDLIPLMYQAQRIVAGGITAILRNPLAFLLLIVLGGYVLQWFGLDEWF